MCENKEITLTHDFNRRNSGKKQTVLLTVSPEGMPLANGFYNIHTVSKLPGFTRLARNFTEEFGLQ
ncbi:MAG: hypothetical protein IIA49_02265 [Bacteroidetes bacterium]|nr:hypothetical protein [Bacteroidota bacterium]